MKRSQVLKAGHFYTVADCLGRAEADIEDMFNPKIFVAMVNGCYDLEDPNPYDRKAKEGNFFTERLVKQAEAAFKSLFENSSLSVRCALYAEMTTAMRIHMTTLSHEMQEPCGGN